MAGNYMRGAFIQFDSPTFLKPVPNVIVFQYNPESITHTWAQAQFLSGVEEPTTDGLAQGHNPLAVRNLPGESFGLTISMDAGDIIADGRITAPLALTTGVYSRLAALEMLQYPTNAFSSATAGLVGSVSASVGQGDLGLSGGSTTTKVLRAAVPVVLFVWGPGRIVPIRVTGLTITEKLYDKFLNPTHADAVLRLEVLTPEELVTVEDKAGKIARATYVYSQALRQGLAIANLANASEATYGMLPF